MEMETKTEKNILILTKECPQCKTIKVCETDFNKVLNTKSLKQNYRTYCKSCQNLKRANLYRQRAGEGIVRKQSVYIKVSDPAYVKKPPKESDYVKKPPKIKKEKIIVTAAAVGSRNYKFYKLPLDVQQNLKFLKYKQISPKIVFNILKIPDEPYTNIKYIYNCNLPLWNKEDPMPSNLEILLANSNISIL